MTDANRRFVFHGAAAALSGHVYRPRAIAGVIETPAASALPVTGGYSQAVAKRRRLAPWLTIGGASTVAEGGFDDRKLAIEMSFKRLAADAVPTTTRVAAAIAGLDLRLDGHRVTATALRASLVASSPKSGGPPIRVAKETDIKGFEIDGCPLRFVINRARFEECDTYEKLARAVGSPTSGGPILTSVVAEIAWAKKPHPTAKIEGHSVYVPDFGRLHFGEMLASTEARRLTLLRLALGSPTGADISAVEVQADGSWYPP
jgi:hypothetical protein